MQESGTILITSYNYKLDSEIVYLNFCLCHDAFFFNKLGQRYN